MLDQAHLVLAAAGFLVGCLALAFATWHRRARPDSDEGAVASALVLLAFVVLIAAGQAPGPAIIAVVVLSFGARFAGASVPTVRVWSTDAYVAAIVATAVLYATLPDTEGPVVLGAALVPVTAAALLVPAAWRGPGAVGAVGSLAAGIVAIAAVAAAGRTAALAVVLAAAVACATLAVVAVRLLLGPRRAPRVTSERARPSR